MRTFWARLFGLEQFTKSTNGWIVALDRRLSDLEDKMTEYDDMLSRLNDATNEVASDLAELKSALESNDLSSADAARRLEPLVSRLEGMGADADNVDPGGATDPATTTDPTNNAPPAVEENVVVDDNGDASVVDDGDEPRPVV